MASLEQELEELSGCSVLCCNKVLAEGSHGVLNSPRAPAGMQIPGKARSVREEMSPVATLDKKGRICACQHKYCF